MAGEWEECCFVRPADRRQLTLAFAMYREDFRPASRMQALLFDDRSRGVSKLPTQAAVRNTAPVQFVHASKAKTR